MVAKEWWHPPLRFQINFRKLKVQQGYFGSIQKFENRVASFLGAKSVVATEFGAIQIPNLVTLKIYFVLPMKKKRNFSNILFFGLTDSETSNQNFTRLTLETEYNIKRWQKNVAGQSRR